MIAVGALGEVGAAEAAVQRMAGSWCCKLSCDAGASATALDGGGNYGLASDSSVVGIGKRGEKGIE